MAGEAPCGKQHGQCSKSEAFGAFGNPGPPAGTSIEIGPAAEQTSTHFVASRPGQKACEIAGSSAAASTASNAVKAERRRAAFVRLMGGRS
jgi:hypothetical protein